MRMKYEPYINIDSAVEKSATSRIFFLVGQQLPIEIKDRIMIGDV